MYFNVMVSTKCLGCCCYFFCIYMTTMLVYVYGLVFSLFFLSFSLLSQSAGHWSSYVTRDWSFIIHQFSLLPRSTGHLRRSRDIISQINSRLDNKLINKYGKSHWGFSTPCRQSCHRHRLKLTLKINKQIEYRSKQK